MAGQEYVCGDRRSVAGLQEEMRVRQQEWLRRREDYCTTELHKTRLAVSELEEMLADPPTDLALLRRKLRAMQAENMQLDKELGRLLQEQETGVCERDTCVHYEERIERLSSFISAVFAEFADRYINVEKTAQHFVEELVAAVNTRTFHCLRSLLARMTDRPERTIHYDKVFVHDVMLLEQRVLSKHRKLLLEEEKLLRHRDGEMAPKMTVAGVRTPPQKVAPVCALLERLKQQFLKESTARADHDRYTRATVPHRRV